MTLNLAVNFQIETGREDRAQFQRDGHFIPAMVDEHGARREWQGDAVFIAELWLESKDASGNVTERARVLRVLADSVEEMDRVMAMNIHDTFFALWQAQQIQATTYDEFRKAHDSDNWNKKEVERLTAELKLKEGGK